MVKYSNILDTPIEFLRGVGPQRSIILKDELGIFTYKDLLFHFPFRYVDKTRLYVIRNISSDSGEVLLKGVLRKVETLGENKSKRIVAQVRDATGSIELVWFRSLAWIEKNLKPGAYYVVYGRVNDFNGRLNIPHPELEELSEEGSQHQSLYFDPVYPSTEKCIFKGLDPKGIRKLVRTLFEIVDKNTIIETLPDDMIQSYRLSDRPFAFKKIHFPENQEELDAASRRLKFEELFFLQLRLLQIRNRRRGTTRGHVFSKIGETFNGFFKYYLPFELTNAQKKVVKEIRSDLGSGAQMNRLVQGDVGSGKTIVSLLAMLIAIDNDFQVCLMAPTEILAQQHFISILSMVEQMGLGVGFLSGSIKGKKREVVLQKLRNNELQILIGTHALLEDWVEFKNLGLCVIDEQHRFGVEQRSRLWKKSQVCPPHILVMTATPIPRTLAMTLYGDLDVSIIDELPPGRKPITTTHLTEHNRLRIIGFMKEEIAKGRQVYVVYPMIEETEKVDLQNLMEGFEALSRDFPQPEFQIAVLHGRMKSSEKDFEMARFVNKQAQIMVATTVIEVGVNVPNASVMVIQNADRFGLSQLHQLRGRVGRGAEKSFCILMTSQKISQDGRERIQTMVATTDGFKIAEVDMKLRGPGNIEGTQQSGLLNFKIADLSKDTQILYAAREIALKILDEDPNLQMPKNIRLKNYLEKEARDQKGWSRIS